MLIKDGNLDIKEFKSMMTKFNWRRVPRWFGPDRKDVFYIVKYEDEEKKIEVSVRPSLRMKVNESFKNYTTKGAPAPENYTGTTVDWGTSVEVLIDEKFLNEIQKLAKNNLETSKVQKVTWD